jgi:hypothetical protein
LGASELHNSQHPPPSSFSQVGEQAQGYSSCSYSVTRLRVCGCDTKLCPSVGQSSLMIYGEQHWQSGGQPLETASEGPERTQRYDAHRLLLEWLVTSVRLSLLIIAIVLMYSRGSLFICVHALALVYQGRARVPQWHSSVALGTCIPPCIEWGLRDLIAKFLDYVPPVWAHWFRLSPKNMQAWWLGARPYKATDWWRCAALPFQSQY